MDELQFLDLMHGYWYDASRDDIFKMITFLYWELQTAKERISNLEPDDPGDE